MSQFRGSEEFTEQLKAAGQFATFRERRQELEKSGEKKAAAWLAAAKEFGFGDDEVVLLPEPEPPEPEPEPPQFTDEEFAALPDSADLRTELEWAKAHVGTDQPDISTAPSPFAVYLWEWGGQNPQKFIEMVLKHVKVRDDSKEEFDRQIRDDHRQQFALIEAILGPGSTGG